VTLPEQFILSIPQKGIQREVELSRHGREEIGVVFREAPPSPPPTPQESEMRARIRDLEAEIVRLKVRIEQLTSG
jgi:hypothetical protein